MAIGGSRIRVDTGPLKNPANFAQTIDIVPLFGGDGGARGAAVRGLGRALQEDGVFVAPRLPEGAQLERRAASLLAFFDLSEADKLRLATRRVRADSRRSYRGYVSTLKQGWAYNEFFDIGPERALPPPAIEAAQIFAETNIWPARPPFPRWRAEMLAYHGAMDSAGAAILATAGEFLGLSESALAPLFAGGGSTLRLLNYPRKPGGAVITEEMPHPDGARLVTGRHVDACALTLLWQRQAGLQAQTPDGRWLDYSLPPGRHFRAFGIGDGIPHRRALARHAAPRSRQWHGARRHWIFPRTQSGRRTGATDIAKDSAATRTKPANRAPNLRRASAATLQPLRGVRASQG